MRLVMRTLNDYLREKRLESGLSQLDVARELGYASPQFVSNWERGLVSPPLETIGILISLYKIPPGDVVDRILDETREYLESHLVTSKKKKGAKNQRPGQRQAQGQTQKRSLRREAHA